MVLLPVKIGLPCSKSNSNRPCFNRQRVIKLGNRHFPKFNGTYYYSLIHGIVNCSGVIKHTANRIQINETTFCDITLCDSAQFHRSFGGTQSLRFCLPPAFRWLLSWLNFRSICVRRYVPLKRRWSFIRLHGVTAQKRTLFRPTPVRIKVGVISVVCNPIF
jgi:hypothetical protein